MKVQRIADKIITHFYKVFLESGNSIFTATQCQALFPDIEQHLIYAAIRQLDHDDLISVLYGDNEPDCIALKISAIEFCENNTLLQKGYRLLKEARDWVK